MAIMYFGFDTDMPVTTPDLSTPNVDYIAFKNRGCIISVSCGWEADFGIEESENGKNLYTARFKDLDCAIINEETDREIHGYREMSEDDFRNYIQGAIPYEIGLCVPEDSVEKYSEDVINASNLEVCIDFCTDTEDFRYEVTGEDIDIMITN